MSGHPMTDAAGNEFTPSATFSTEDGRREVALVFIGAAMENRFRAFDAETKPRLNAFLNRIHARPAYQRALERGGPYSYA